MDIYTMKNMNKELSFQIKKRMKSQYDKILEDMEEMDSCGDRSISSINMMINIVFKTSKNLFNNENKDLSPSDNLHKFKAKIDTAINSYLRKRARRINYEEKSIARIAQIIKKEAANGIGKFASMNI